MPVVSRTLKIVLDTVYLAARYLVIRCVGFVVLFLTTRALGPEGFAVLKLVQLIPTFSKYTGLGVNSVLLREVKSLRGRLLADWHERNVAYTFSVLFALVCFVIVAPILLFSFPQYKMLILIASLIWMLNEFFKLLINDCSILKDFKSIAKAEVSASLVGLVILFITLDRWGIEARIFSDLVVCLVGGGLLFFRSGLRFRFVLDVSESIRQLRISVPLFSLTLLTGVWTWSERLIVTFLWGGSAAGVYLFGIAIVEVLNGLVSSAIQSISVYLYEVLHSESKRDDDFDLAAVSTILLSIFASMGASILMLFGPFVVDSFFAAFSALKDMLYWLSLLIWLYSIQAVLLTACTSERINKQRELLLLRIVCISLHIGATVLFFELGLDVQYSIVAKTIASAIGFIWTWKMIADIFGYSAGTFRDCFYSLIPFLCLSVALLIASQGIQWVPAVILLLFGYAFVFYVTEERTGFMRMLAKHVLSRMRRLDS